MNKIINFEISKLLKEKGFDELTTTWHQRGEGVVGCVDGKRDFYNRKGDVYTSAPTIAEVVMWLYEKNDIWIISSYEIIEMVTREWSWGIIKNGEEIAYNYSGYKSSSEAYEAAIKYTFEYIID